MKRNATWLVIVLLVLSQWPGSGWAQMQSIPIGGTATNLSSVMYFQPPFEQLVQWRLTGDAAEPLPGAMFDLKQLKVENYNTNGTLVAVVKAPQCTFAVMDHLANSPGHLELVSGDAKFHVEGDGFFFDQNKAYLVISNNVHTVIEMNAKDFIHL